MRIAVFHNLPSGGGLRAMNEQIARLHGQVAAVYTFSGRQNDQLPDDCVVRAYTLPQRGLFRRPLGRLNGAINTLNLVAVDRLSRRVAEEVDRQGYDAVLVHPCGVAQTPPILRYLRTPTLYYCQEPFRAMHEALLKGGVFIPGRDPLRSAYSRMAVRMEDAALHAATLVLCNSRYSREYLVRVYGVGAEVNYLGIDADIFRPLSVPKANTVLSVGRLSPLKGHEFIVETVARIEPAKRPTLGIIGGSGEAIRRSQIQALADSRGVSVVFHENVSDEGLVKLYNSATASVVAAVLEPFGLVPLESMACGTPVVAVAEGGIRETVLHGVTGYLTGRDPDEFAQAIISLLDAPDLAAGMGRAGREHVLKHWTWDESIRGLEAYLRKAVAGQR